MKRKILAKLMVVLWVVIILSISVSVAAFAATDTSAYVSSNTAISRGEEVTFTVGISNGTEIQSILIIPKYDSSTFELIGGSWTLSGGSMSDFSVSTGDGVILFNPGISVNGNVLTFTLKVKDNAAFGMQNVSADVIITDSNGNSTLNTSGASVEIKCSHSFTKEDTTYLKSEASCTSSAIYYKSCVTCGEKGTETFEYGDVAAHSYTREVQTDAYKKSGASCTAKAVYYYCCATCDAKGTLTYETGSTLNHVYTRKVITDAYKVSNADCDSKAVYNYCCETCDAKGTETFEDGEALGHTGGTATCTAKAECTRCGQPYGNMLDHVYTDEEATETYLKSEATCTSKEVYYKNCATCDKAGTDTFERGDKKDHSYTREVQTDAYKKSDASCAAKAVYYYCCATCDAKGTLTYETGSILDHSYTRQVISDTYKVSDADCDSKATYYYCCETCDKVGTITYENGDVLGHTGGTATCTAKAECTRCGQPYGNMLDHVYTDEEATETYLKSEATCTSKAVYYKNCATCDKAGTDTFESGNKKDHSYTQKVDDLYLKSAASCTEKAVYYESCSVCGEKGTITFTIGEEPSHQYKTTWSFNAASHWHECSKCGDKKDEAAHQEGDTATTSRICTICNYVIRPALGHIHSYSSQWTSDATAHWHVCQGCGDVKDTADHSYSNGCDVDCNVCGYTRTIKHNYNANWFSDSEKHWHVCDTCGQRADEANHTAGAEATETTAQLCTVCGYVIKEALGHTHNYSDLKKDGTNHWSECACGDKTNVAAHTWDEGVVTVEPTYEATGDKTYTCTACGSTKIEKLDMLVKVEEIVAPDNGDVKITTPEGSTAVLPANTELKVEEVKREVSEAVKETVKSVVGNNNAELLASYDISLILDGVTVQPGGAVEVTLPIPQDVDDYDTLQVVYVDDNGSVTLCETRVNADGTITFVTNHFSYYAIIGVQNTTPVVWIAIASICVLLIAGIVVFCKKKKA